MQLRRQQMCTSITKSGDIQFSIRSLLMLHCRFANAIQVFSVEIKSAKIGERENRQLLHP